MSGSSSHLKCRLLWKLCRKHGWGSPVPRDALLNLALQDSDQGYGETLVDDLLEEPYIEHDDVRGGYQVKNNPDSQAQAACRLQSDCGYATIQIEATLSRFKQAGGFDAYSREDVLDDLGDW